MNTYYEPDSVIGTGDTSMIKINIVTDYPRGTFCKGDRQKVRQLLCNVKKQQYEKVQRQSELRRRLYLDFGVCLPDLGFGGRRAPGKVIFKN